MSSVAHDDYQALFTALTDVYLTGVVFGGAGGAAYAASKHAVMSISERLAL